MGYDANRNTHLKAIQASDLAEKSRQLVIGFVNLTFLNRLTWLVLGPKYLDQRQATKAKAILLAIAATTIAALSILVHVCR